jgi:transcriptional regulator with XRE-family HTH domain
MKEIGPRIRDLRTERGLTLGEMAEQVGCSPSFISQVERGKVSPSIATLKKITTVLNATIVDLFLDSFNLEPVVMHERDRVEITMKSWKAKVNLLVRSTHGKRMQPFFTVLRPGGGASDVYSHQGEEFGLILDGELELTLNGSTYRLKKNDSFYFSSQIPHSWVNPSEGETRIVWVVSPPTW